MCKKRFENKVAIVSGGANGIGLATVERLCAEGASVLFSDLSGDDGRRVASRLVAEGYAAKFVQGDMSEEAFCGHLAEKADEHFGGVDLLVNNAFAFVAASLNATTQDWERSLFTGPVAFARMAQAVAPLMKKRGGGGDRECLVDLGAYRAKGPLDVQHVQRGGRPADEMRGFGSGGTWYSGERGLARLDLVKRGGSRR